LREPAGDKNPAVRLDDDGAEFVIDRDSGGEAVIERTIGLQSGKISSGLAMNAGELATDEHLSVRLNCHRVNAAIGTRSAKKGRVDRAAPVEAGEASA
jgi:hypothetical protein